MDAFPIYAVGRMDTGPGLPSALGGSHKYEPLAGAMFGPGAVWSAAPA